MDGTLPGAARPGVAIDRRTLVPLLLAVALGGLLLVLLAPDRLTALAAEDAQLEDVQAASYVVAALLCARGLVRRRAGGWGWLVGAGALVLAGEELSWGQRILGLSTPGPLDAHNRQHELNLHNLDPVHDDIRTVGVVLVLLVFLGLPLLVRASARAGGVLRRLRFRLPDVLCATAAVLSVAFMSLPRVNGSNSFRTDEIGELFLAWTVLAYAALVSRRPSTGR